MSSNDIITFIKVLTTFDVKCQMTFFDERQHDVKRHFGVIMNVNCRQNMTSIDVNLCMTLPLLY